MQIRAWAVENLVGVAVVSSRAIGMRVTRLTIMRVHMRMGVHAVNMYVVEEGNRGFRMLLCFALTTLG